MNAYVVWIPETRQAYGYADPPEPWMPVDVFAAETRGQAKIDALSEWTAASLSGVYEDDFTSLRCRILAADVPLARGVLPYDREEGGLYDRLWARVHDVLDHGGKPCDCPVEDEAAA